jgi:hypothetical protein
MTAAAVAGIEGVPVHAHPAHVELAERQQGPFPVVVALVEGGQEGSRPRGEAGLADPGQGGLGADLDEDLAARRCRATSRRRTTASGCA